MKLCGLYSEVSLAAWPFLDYKNIKELFKIHTVGEAAESVSNVISSILVNSSGKNVQLKLIFEYFETIQNSQD